ncbi:hypothetical protein Tco_1164252 [Tanacetum coccineum]
MPPKRNNMSTSVIEELITQRVADALADYEANRNSGNGNDNGNWSHDLGNSGGRTPHTARVCTYKDFLNCQALNSKGTEGACATCTLLGGALTWWNSHVKSVGHDVAYRMPWKTLIKMITEAYCPGSELKKLETKLWNLTVKGTDVESYTQRFQELVLLCSRMIPNDADKVERYVGGLPDNIQGSVMASKPKILQEAIEFVRSLMDQKIEYAGTIPLCNKCKLHHNVSCTVKWANCKKVGHMAWDCRNPTAAVNQRTLTCFECGNQGHYRSECPILKNQNCGNQTRNGEARGRVYALGGGEVDQDPDNIADDVEA